MKTFLLTSFLFLMALSSSAETTDCAEVDAKNIFLLGQEVVLQGTVLENPMITSVPDNSPLKAKFIKYAYMILPSDDVMLEQWSATQTNYACRAEVITLTLNKSQRDVIEKNRANGINLVTVKGSITWSESSLTGAGNGMLLNISSVSAPVEKNP